MFDFLVVSTSAIDGLESLVSEMTYYVSSGTLNPTHSLTDVSALSTSVLAVTSRQFASTGVKLA